MPQTTSFNPAIKNALLFAEKAFTIASLIQYTGGVLVVFLSGGASEGDGLEGEPNFPLIQLIFLVIYGITFCLLAIRWKKAIQVIIKNWAICILLILAILSIFWSESPDMTKARTIALSGTTLFSLYLASRYSLKEQLHLLGWTFGIIIIGSLLFIFGLPKYGVMGGIHAGAWRGIYSHKNSLGRIMVPSTMLFLILAIGAETKRWVFWGGLSLSVFLLIAAKSGSAITNLLMLLITFFSLRILRWKYEFMIASLLLISIISLLIGMFLDGNAAVVADSFGKDLTLTGRTNFWPFIIDKIWQRPWLGYGYGAFWLGLDGQSADVWYASGWEPPNSHNGYLDLSLELGLIGLSIYLSIFVATLLKGLAYIRFIKTSEAFWPTIYLMYIVLSNLTESTLIIQNNYFFVVQFAIFMSIAMPSIQQSKVLLQK